MIRRATTTRFAARLLQRASVRSFTAQSPGDDPLELFRKTAEGRNLCDAGGYRKPGTHWTFALAVSSGDGGEAPNLRTLNIQRASSSGIEFVNKRGSASSLLANASPVSFLYAVGKYKPGETVEQWRADGICEHLDLGSIIEKVPHYSITETVSTVRAAKELQEKGEAGGVSKDRMLMGRQSHFMEVVQKTRIELENGDVSDEELEQCLKAWRFLPERMERMTGGPDNIMWDRWEWLRAEGACPEGTALWSKPQHILPY